MKIIVVRHGQTDWNILEKIQGQTDIELNDTGREQAKQTGNSIKNEKIDIIITSPLKRTLETAQIINTSLNVPILKDERLKERYFGKFEGLTKTQIREMKKDNSLVGEAWNYNKNVEFNNMENMQNFCNRVYEFLDEISEKYKDKTILLVTHGGVSVPLKCYCMHYPLEKIENRHDIKGMKNCEVYSCIL